MIYVGLKGLLCSSSVKLFMKKFKVMLGAIINVDFNSYVEFDFQLDIRGYFKVIVLH